MNEAGGNWGYLSHQEACSWMGQLHESDSKWVTVGTSVQLMQKTKINSSVGEKSF